MPDITGVIHHVNLSVSDLGRSARWYTALLDLTEVMRATAEDDSLTKVILRHHSGLLVGLTEHRRNDGSSFEEWRSGVDHVAFAVSSVDELNVWQARLDELAIEHSPVKTTPLGSLITLRDPDNIQLELYAPHRSS